MKKSGSVKTDDTVVMDRAAMREVLDRIAAAIVENHKDDDMMAFVGIRTGGIHIARRLVANIQEHLGREVPLGTLATVVGMPGRMTVPFCIRTSVVCRCAMVLDGTFKRPNPSCHPSPFNFTRGYQEIQYAHANGNSVGDLVQDD